jgi:hypothetical protein
MRGSKGMSQAHNRSLSLALGRLRFAVVTSCWVIALCLVAQIVVWSLCTFTELRHTEPLPPDGVPQIVGGDEKPGKPARARAAAKRDARWTPDSGENEDAAPVSSIDRVFKISVTVARTMCLMGSLLICGGSAWAGRKARSAATSRWWPQWMPSTPEGEA